MFLLTEGFYRVNAAIFLDIELYCSTNLQPAKSLLCNRSKHFGTDPDHFLFLDVHDLKSKAKWMKWCTCRWDEITLHSLLGQTSREARLSAQSAHRPQAHHLRERKEVKLSETSVRLRVNTSTGTCGPLPEAVHLDSLLLMNTEHTTHRELDEQHWL